MNLVTKTAFVQTFLKERSHNSTLKLIEHVNSKGLEDSEIIELAVGLANSGQTIKNDNGFEYCDIPSTGGPSSLSTLICPLFLTAIGGKVVKLGVPGRPAGGVDVLAQISGYRVDISFAEITAWRRKHNYIHLLANDIFAPLDAQLFKARKENNALDIPDFVIASLLAKKIAVGVKTVGLDIRVSHFGNFGKTFEEARANAIRFNRIANALDLRSKCFITDGSIPQQPYIGRGESILAIHKIFNDNCHEYLKKHLGVCAEMAFSLLEAEETEISVSELKEVFFENVKTQGGDLNHFNELANSIEEEIKHSIESVGNGILSVDLLKIRNAITKIQNYYSQSQFSDPCGVILTAMPGNYVERGDVLSKFRCKPEYTEEFNDLLKQAFIVTNRPNYLMKIEVVK